MNLQDEFQRIGKRLRDEGLVGANFGNMSVRKDAGFCITRAGAFLDSPGDLVYVPMENDASGEASTEYRLHREVYRTTFHNAVVHAHPPYAVAASLDHDCIIPVDSEGEMFCSRIPVVTGPPGSMEMARNVATVLKDKKVVIVRGHGTFCGARSLEEGYILTSVVEHSCRILLLSRGP